MDLAEFLLARIADDEAVARAAHYEGQRWYPEEEAVGRWPEICDCDCPVRYAANRKIEAEHIANWDPARVLAECEAKRRLILQLQSAHHHNRWAAEALREAEVKGLRLLALSYSDHPDYREEWSA